MNALHPTPTLADPALWGRISAIDLTMVKRKLTESDEGPKWSKAKAEAVEVLYRRFLYMTCMRPGHSVVPSKTIDAMWHAHILDTRAYMADCEAAFGEYLHHFPYFGMRGEDDAQALTNAFRETGALYEATFGEPYELPGVESGCEGGCSGCGNDLRNGPNECASCKVTL